MNIAPAVMLVLSSWCVSGGTATAPVGQVVNSLGMVLVPIHPDQFMTGTRLDRANWSWFEGAEIPRWVRISRGFCIGAHEVTNGQYREFVKATGRAAPRGLRLRGSELATDFEPWNDPAFSGDKLPVVCVTYADAEAFCTWLSQKEGRTYRLPTSEEWEYACRAGQGTDYNWGSDRITPDMANYDPFVVESDAGSPAPMFSLQEAARLRGGTATYDAAARQATGTIAGKAFRVVVGKREAEVQGRVVVMEVPAVLEGQQVLVPARFLACDLELMFTGGTKPVDSFRSSEWGLYNMHGNVNEITSTGGVYRVVRGGGWCDSARRCRSASVRDRWKSECGMASIGFRVVCELPAVRRLEVSVGEPIVVKPVVEDRLLTVGRTILQLRDGTLILLDRMSTDGGKTWQACPVQPNPVVVQLSDGAVLSIPFTIPRDKDKPRGFGKAACLMSTDGWRTVVPFEAVFHVPDAIGGFGDSGEYNDSVGWCDHGIVELPGGDLLLTMYGFFGSARVLSDYQRYPIEMQQWKYVSWIAKSSDMGRTWSYLSTSIHHPELTRGGGSEEGLVRLANGDLLLAARTGEHGYPNERMLFVWSKDAGRTWESPSFLNVDDRPILGIYPQFVPMQNGILAMTWGRTGDAGTAVAFSPDGRGQTWCEFTPIPDDAGGYNDIVEIQPGRLLVSVSKKVGEHYDLRLIPLTVRRSAATQPAK